MWVSATFSVAAVVITSFNSSFHIEIVPVDSFAFEVSDHHVLQPFVGLVLVVIWKSVPVLEFRSETRAFLNLPLEEWELDIVIRGIQHARQDILPLVPEVGEL